MQNPQMPNMPGAGAMGDSLEFVKNLWGNMGVPGIAAPTLSVDDLDKKIKDLKAVEIWLNVNMSMVRGTIQALEVQRATLTALKSMGEAMAGQGNPFAAFAQPGVAGQPPEAGAAPADAAGAAGAAQGDAEKPAAGGADAAAAMGMANPALWWATMQEQFQQALAQAVSAQATATPAAQEAAPAAPGKPSGSTASPKPRARRKAE